MSNTKATLRAYALRESRALVIEAPNESKRLRRFALRCH